MTPRDTLWPAILDGGWAGSLAADDGTRAAAARLADLVTPALAEHLLARAAAAAGAPLVDPDAARESRLMNRFTGGVQRRWMREIAAAGLPVVALKGYVYAHTLYPDPDVRTIGDLDLLVRAADLDAVLDFLTGHGFGFEPLETSAWGFISDASFMPLMSADGTCNIDLHVEPDCYPAYRSLTADRLIAAARTVEIDGAAVAVPSAEHGLVLCLTNAAKDKFGPYAVRKLVDIATVLRQPAPIDWREVEVLAREGHFLGPARVAFALLVALGLPATLVPEPLRRPPRGLRRTAFDRLVADVGSMFESEPPARRILARELLLCTEPDVGLYNAWRRLRGLARPATGLPAGHAPRTGSPG